MRERGNNETFFQEKKLLRSRQGQIENPADFGQGQLFPGDDGADKDGYRQGDIQVYEN